MCGRFSQSSPSADYASRLAARSAVAVKPRYNIAPSTDILACRLSADGDRELRLLHWGLVPSWSKGPDKRFSMINARAETLQNKPAYRGPFRHHRCLIPADGFYEWHQLGQAKQPYYIHRKDNAPLFFAGLWDHWDDGEGDHIDSCSIITTTANTLMSGIHERMPVILAANVVDDWLGSDDTAHLQSLLRPDESDTLEYYPVSTMVNNPRNDGPELIRRV